jgi:Predicted transcriptional regulator containing an HTH domain and an uncharacterized domain shared with the mammalian protein Schlafen
MYFDNSENVNFRNKYLSVVFDGIVYFLNDNGGKLYVGMDDHGNVVGVENPDYVEIQLMYGIRSCITPSATQYVTLRREIRNDKKQIIVVQVRKGANAPYQLIVPQKEIEEKEILKVEDTGIFYPYYDDLNHHNSVEKEIKDNLDNNYNKIEKISNSNEFDNQTTINNHQEKKIINNNPLKLKLEEINNLELYFENDEISNPEEEIVSPKEEFNHLITNSIINENYEQLNSLNQQLTFNEISKQFIDFDKSFNLKHQQLNIINNNGLYTNLGLLLSDQAPHSIKLAIFNGSNKLSLLNKKEFNGSILTQFNKVFEFIQQYSELEYELNDSSYLNNWNYPKKAIKEALLNAIVHKDYSIKTSIIINIFSNKIEIISIGGLIQNISYQDIELGLSMPRNPLLMDLFCELKLKNGIGSGLSKIMESYDQKENKPKIDISKHVFKITLPNIN